VSIKSYLNYTIQYTEIIKAGPPRLAPGQNFPGGPYEVIIVKREKRFSNILHFIAYYPSLTQLGFIFLLSNLVSINFNINVQY
jgi:hypothetical protein